VSTQLTAERPPTAPPRLPKELLANAAFLLARLGISFKGRAVEEVEAAGYSLYDYSVLDSLEERGLVERRRDPNDRRRHLVSLTSEGRKQLGRLRTIIGRLEGDLLAPLDAAERETLHQLVLKLSRHHDPRCAG
jgi:hypothetical protein